MSSSLRQISLVRSCCWPTEGPCRVLTLCSCSSPRPTGYSRIILAGVALHFMSYHPKYCTLAYGISCLLDAADGYAARALGQSSKFGAVLDMVTDRCVCLHDAFCVYTHLSIRCTTSSLLIYLSSVYPDYTMIFQLLITLDFFSHYMHMYRYVS